MPAKTDSRSKRRNQLLQQIQSDARRAIFGTPAESYRTCGTPTCRCHGPGPKHGPHLYISYRGEPAKTTGYYVPKAAQKSIRDGVEAWQRLQKSLRELTDMNKQNILEQARKQRSANK